MKRALVLTLTAIFIGLCIPALFLRNRQAETEETEAETQPEATTQPSIQAVPSGDSKTLRNRPELLEAAPEEAFDAQDRKILTERPD